MRVVSSGRWRLLVLVLASSCFVGACDAERPPRSASAADVDVTLHRSGDITIEARLGGQPSQQDLQVVGDDIAAQIGFVDADARIGERSDYEFVDVRLPDAYERGRAPRVEVDFGAVASSLAGRGYVDLSVRLSTPSVPVTIEVEPGEIRSSDNAMAWERNSISPDEIVVRMAPEPDDFWLLLVGVVVGLVALFLSAALWVRGRRHWSVARRRSAVRAAWVAVGVSSFTALSLPFDQVDDLGVAGGASGSALPAANGVAIASMLSAVVAIAFLIIVRRRPAPDHPVSWSPPAPPGSADNAAHR